MEGGGRDEDEWREGVATATAMGSHPKPQSQSQSQSESQSKSESQSSSPSLLSRGRRSPRELQLNRVQEELEKLNIATDVINKLELQLDDARSAFAEIRSSWSAQLEALSRRLGGCIAKSRPFYEAKLRARQLQEEAQKAVLRFERANTMHTVAKQQVALTQDSLFRQKPGDVDPACLEVLNHHVQRVNEAEVERLSSEDEHRRISLLVEEANKHLHALEKDLARHIKKSKVYFDRRLEFTRVLEDQKALIQRIETEVRQKKMDYQTSLRNLELISERIHEERKLGQREEEEENNSPPSTPQSPDLSVPTVMVRINAGGSPEPKKRPAKGLSPKVKDLLKAISPKSKEEQSPRSVSEPPESMEEKKKRGGEEEAGDEGRERGGSLSIPSASGILLIAQQLQEYGWLGGEESEAKAKAFTFPPEDLDMAYRTLPEGVKAFPSPPATPIELGVSNLCPEVETLSLSDRSEHSSAGPFHFRPGHSRQASDVPTSGNDSDASSLSSRSLNVDDEGLRGMLRSHTAMIQEIESVAERAKSAVHLSPPAEESLTSHQPD